MDNRYPLILLAAFEGRYEDVEHIISHMPVDERRKLAHMCSVIQNAVSYTIQREV